MRKLMWAMVSLGLVALLAWIPIEPLGPNIGAEGRCRI